MGGRLKLTDRQCMGPEVLAGIFCRGHLANYVDFGKFC